MRITRKYSSFSKIEALQERLDAIENRLDTLYCYYCSSETSSDSDSSESVYDYVPTSSEKKISKAKCVKVKSAQARNKKAKHRRNPARAVRSKNYIIESDNLTSNG